MKKALLIAAALAPTLAFAQAAKPIDVKDIVELELLTPVVKRLGERASLKLFADADHSFHVPARTGRKDSEVMVELLDTLVEWMK